MTQLKLISVCVALGFFGCTSCAELQTDAAQSSASLSGNTPVTAGGISNSPNARVHCKRGMVIGNEVHPALSSNDLHAVAPGVSWWYNYSYLPLSAELGSTGRSLGIDYVPMAFTASSLNSANITLDANSGFLLAFNEPNFSAQANLTPQAAAAAWPKIEQLAAMHNLKIVGPALNYCGGGCNETSPFDWLDNFFKACPSCRMDHIAIHSYVCYSQALQSAYLTPFYRYKRPIWVTEFSCLDGSADASKLAVQQNAMRTEVAAMESDPNVFRYAWFIGRSNDANPPLSLLGADGQLTALGQLYVSLPQSCDNPNQ